ncbi:glycosyltransferase family 9 protein [Simkania negevensis]|uniref:Glycosyltransferase family 9 protein n=1 Tax=Simkania negevensis TaxID=83561 RepID=A0ABS3APM0_9BACT|nr:glycosyltransferase family 9 protein [Simkania negevensis]
MMSDDFLNLASACRIAVVRRNQLGDLLMTVPLLHCLKERAKNASLTLFVDEANALLLPYIGLADSVVVFSRKGNRYLNVLIAGYKSRKEHFDLAISAKASPMKLMNLFLFATRAKKRIAYAGGFWSDCFLNAPVLYDEDVTRNQHQALKMVQLIDSSIKEVPEKWYPRISLPADLIERCKINSLNTLPLPGPLLLVSVSNHRAASTPSNNYYAGVLNALYKEAPFRTVISCQSKDLERAKALSSKLSSPSIPIATPSLESFLVLLHHVDVVFSGDGGTMHMAAALNKPQLVLFGITRTEEWRPLSSCAVCLQHPEDVNFIPQQEALAALRSVNVF